MKKILPICLIVIIIIVGGVLYSNTGPDKTTCIQEFHQEPYDLLVNEYTIYSEDDIVTKVVTKKTAGCNDQNRLKEVEDNINNSYKTMNEKYSGYSYKSSIKNNKLVSVAEIDYKVFDMEKYVNDIVAMKAYVNEKNQYTLEGAKQYYQHIGATCNE